VHGIAVGLTHTCALGANGQVACWGRNDAGMLGFESDTSCFAGDRNARCATQPGVAPFIRGATAIAAADSVLPYSCAIVGGTLTCWGRSDFGQRRTETTAAFAVTEVHAASPLAATSKVSVAVTEATTGFECATEPVNLRQAMPAGACRVLPRQLSRCSAETIQRAIAANQVYKKDNSYDPADVAVRGYLKRASYCPKVLLGCVEVLQLSATDRKISRHPRGPGQAPVLLKTSSSVIYANPFGCSQRVSGPGGCCAIAPDVEVVATGVLVQAELTVREICRVSD
jgi:hypothetical protein